MANIFSGILGGSSSGDGQALVQYKQQMDEYEAKRATWQRGQDVDASEEEFELSIKDMSPERQAQARFFRKQTTLQSMGDKGLEGLNKTMGQRGSTISDLIKSEDDLEKDKALWDYKLKNPQAGTANKDIEWAQYLENLKDTDQDAYERALISKRQEQFLDQGPQYISTITGDIVAKDLIKKGVDEARAPIIAEELGSFYNDMDNTEFTLDATYRQRQRMRELFDMTDGSTTGWGAVLKWFPGSDAKEWDAKKIEIMSNIGLDKIMDLKAGSAQGATGLGALNEKELEMLQTYLGRIEQSRDPQGLKRSIERMDRWMGRLMSKRQKEAIRRRRQYDEHKHLVGRGARGTPDDIPEYQEAMFSTEPWVSVPMESSFVSDDPASITDFSKASDQDVLNALGGVQ